jgi:drug/metabolite transporter (DMT)-like permease
VDLAGYLLICLIWGSTWLAIKVGLDAGVPTFLGAALRFLVAAAILLPLAWIYKRPAFSDRAAWRLALFIGAFSFCIGYGLNYWGGHYIPSGLSGLTFSFFPVWVAVMARFMVGERFTPFKVAAIAVGMGGVTTLFWGSWRDFGPQTLPGVVAVSASVIVQGYCNIRIKRDGQTVPTLFLNAVAMGSGSLLLFLASLLHREDWRALPLTAPALASILYLGTFGSIVTFMIYYGLMKRVSATLMACVAMITPPLSVLAGHFARGEVFPPRILLAGSLILCGVGGFILSSRFARVP